MLAALTVTVAMPPWPGKIQELKIVLGSTLHLMLVLLNGGVMTHVGSDVLGCPAAGVTTHVRLSTSEKPGVTDNGAVATVIPP